MTLTVRELLEKLIIQNFGVYKIAVTFRDIGTYLNVIKVIALYLATEERKKHIYSFVASVFIILVGELLKRGGKTE